MKRIKTIILIIGILVAGCAFNVAAQSKAERSASARAYYGYNGYKPQKSKFKKPKKQKVSNFTHTRPAKGTRTTWWPARRKYAHT